jgi:hypothetical protein
MSMVTLCAADSTLARMDRIEELLRLEAETPFTEAYAIRRELRALQDAEQGRLARSLGLTPYPALGSPRNWNVNCLRDGAIWCNLCLRGCGIFTPGHSKGFPHSVGFSEYGKASPLYAVLVHTRAPFVYVEDYARELRLKCVPPVWSWMGREFSAVMFIRGDAR